MHRDLCMWFVEIRGFQQANSAEDLKELMRSYSKDIFKERDFDKVDRANKEYQKCTQD